MATVTDDPRAMLLGRVREDLGRAERLVARLGRTNRRLLTGSLAASAASTTIAGLTAAAGPLIGQGVGAWRWTCAVAAVVSGVSALFTGTHQRFTVGERLASARACAAQLRALELALGVNGQGVEEGARQYEDIVRQHPELSG